MNHSRIPTPWPLRFERMRHAVLPVVTFVGCAIATLWLWQRQMPHSAAVGEAEVVRLDISAPADGTLVEFRSPWALYENVSANQVLARLDDRVARQQLEMVRLELEQLRREVEAERAKELVAENDRQITHLRELLRATWEAETRRLDVLDRKVALEVANVELQRRNARLEYLKPLLDSGAANRLQYTEEQLLRDKLQRQVAEGVGAVEEATRQREAAMVRLGKFPPLDEAQLQAILAPLQAAVSVKEAYVKQLEYEIRNLEIRAPITGSICAVYRWPGQTVKQGDPLVSIAAGQSRYIVSYVRQEQRLQPSVGMAVEIRSRRAGGRYAASLVDRVGSQIELLPEHHRRDPKLMEWGLPVRITLPSQIDALPGELFDIRFRPDSADGPPNAG